MDIFEKALGDIIGGCVLDVATHEGGFVQVLMQNLKSYTEIVGIDIHENAIGTAQKTFKKKNIQFLVMDAECLSFGDASFDTVSISASLHHVANIPLVLSEMMRVLKPNGRFIMAEMHSDGQTAAQLTTVYLHHWIADVDSALGMLHNHTLARQELVDYMWNLGLSEITSYEFYDAESDAMEKEVLAGLEELIDTTTRRAQGTSFYLELKERGEALRQRLHEVGAQMEPRLVAVGKKL